MIKGVNKKVLEINNPKSLYFEKAVLYLKPNLSSVSAKLLRAEAQKMLLSMSPYQKKHIYFLRAAILAAVFLTGFLGALVAYLLIY